jgi:hypothetical protein
MNTQVIIPIVASCLLVARGVSGQQPPNDDFAERMVLAGNDIVFTGSLSGSTVEANEPIDVPCGYVSFPATRSVWWTWTATESTPVTLAALAYSEDTYFQGRGEFTCAVAIYEGTNILGSLAAVPKSCLCLNAALKKVAVSFPATAGTVYQFQFLGVHPTLAVTLQLIATNPPVILEAPTEQAILPGGSALFKVLATGLTPLSYRWRLNGVDLPGSTNAMLALNHVATNEAGAYTVEVSNSTGMIVAGPANLILNSHPFPPGLDTAVSNSSNSFAFTLCGERGRYYRVESSTNLAAWRSESSFPLSLPILIYPPNATPYRSVIYNANSNIGLSIPRSASAEFVRASVYSAPDEVCNNNLKQIKFAVELWARSGKGRSRLAAVPMTDLQPYCPDIAGFKCPMGGTFFYDSYIINDVLTDPRCMRGSTHVLEEPK